MAKIKYSADAKQDLEQICDYIVETLKNPMAALNAIGKIRDAENKLSDFPFIGKPLPPFVDEGSDYRFLVCGNYLTLYRATEEIVYIDRILHGKRDYMKILFGEITEDSESGQMK